MAPDAGDSSSRKRKLPSDFGTRDTTTIAVRRSTRQNAGVLPAYLQNYVVDTPRQRTAANPPAQVNQASPAHQAQSTGPQAAPGASSKPKRSRKPMKDNQTACRICGDDPGDVRRMRYSRWLDWHLCHTCYGYFGNQLVYEYRTENRPYDKKVNDRHLELLKPKSKGTEANEDKQEEEDDDEEDDLVLPQPPTQSIDHRTRRYLELLNYRPEDEDEEDDLVLPRRPIQSIDRRTRRYNPRTETMDPLRPQIGGNSNSGQQPVIPSLTIRTDPAHSLSGKSLPVGNRGRIPRFPPTASPSTFPPRTSVPTRSEADDLFPDLLAPAEPAPVPSGQVYRPSNLQARLPSPERLGGRIWRASNRMDYIDMIRASPHRPDAQIRDALASKNQIDDADLSFQEQCIRSRMNPEVSAEEQKDVAARAAALSDWSVSDHMDICEPRAEDQAQAELKAEPKAEEDNKPEAMDLDEEIW